MNCGRVLHALGTPPQQPMDLAMQLCLSQSQPLYHLISMSSVRSSKAQREPAKDAYRPDRPDRPSSPCFSSLNSSSSCSSPSSSLDSSFSLEPRSCLRRPGSGAARKRVVFADARGLSLTAVRLFVPEPTQNAAFATLSRTHQHLKKPQLPSSPLAVRKQLPTPPLPAPMPAPMPAPLPTLGPAGKRRHYQLKLASVVPPLDLSSGLRDARVQLESCCVTERGLMGSARVACGAAGEERTVHLRVTFDAWRSHRDVPCIVLLQRCGNTQTDVFAFHVPLPRNLLDPSEGVEFCLCVRVQGGGQGPAVYWDNNRGQNYRVACVESEDPQQQQQQQQQTHARTAALHTLLPPFSFSPSVSSSSPSSSSSSTSSSSSSSSTPASPDMKNYINRRSAWSRQSCRQPDVFLPMF